MKFRFMPYSIEVKNIWKKYRYGRTQSLTTFLPSLFAKSKVQEFWALKNINLTVRKGESIGIIGPNGSGKSTLLKILTGVTSPTKGTTTIHGKIASLLELGTGFHPDLTGRENIYLYGAILGMSRNEVAKKFKDIVDFSGIAKFLDTPLKHYSSGMYIRLGFSVAIHLDWEILIVDEVLGVGDESFQKISLAKLEEIIKEREKTLIFVSHNLSMIEKICTRSLLVENGHITNSGKPKHVIDYYFKYYVQT